VGILTNYTKDITAINIYNWSIRKVLFKHTKKYKSILIGYVPYYKKIEIVCIKKFTLEERIIISDDNLNNMYFLSGQSGLTSKAKKILHFYNIKMQIINEIDTTNKYQKLDDYLSGNRLITRSYFFDHADDKIMQDAIHKIDKKL